MAREPIEVLRGLALPPGEVEIEFSRSSGPGGQNVNKLETRVTLRFAPERSSVLSPLQKERVREALGHRISAAGELAIHASEHRSRERNLEAARTRLARLLADALRPRRTRRPTKPTKGSKVRRLEGKRRSKEKKEGRRSWEE